MSDTLNILAVSGSLRQASRNTALLRIAAGYAPADMTITEYGIGELPLYNQDLVTDRYPAPVERWRQAIRDADGMLFASPEYNWSVTGVLKNALDWGSRPDVANRDRTNAPLWGKPCAVMAAGGRFGGVRGLVHFRQIAASMAMEVMQKPDVAVIMVPDSPFDAAGNLHDEQAQWFIKELVRSLGAWVRLMAAAE
jgi:chromate reductase, NAD(P)H dehydrogenase (quinone)